MNQNLLFVGGGVVIAALVVVMVSLGSTTPAVTPTTIPTPAPTSEAVPTTATPAVRTPDPVPLGETPKAVYKAPVQARVVAPAPEILAQLLPEEISDVGREGDAFIVTTSFGAKWRISQAQVDDMPRSLQVRFIYSREGSGGQ